MRPFSRRRPLQSGNSPERVCYLACCAALRTRPNRLLLPTSDRLNLIWLLLFRIRDSLCVRLGLAYYSSIRLGWGYRGSTFWKKKVFLTDDPCYDKSSTFWSFWHFFSGRRCSLTQYWTKNLANFFFFQFVFVFIPKALYDALFYRMKRTAFLRSTFFWQVGSCSPQARSSENVLVHLSRTTRLTGGAP